jgi:hypothetical protein
MGRRGVYPPLFCEECENGLESVGCGRRVSKSVQAAENERVAGGRASKKYVQAALTGWLGDLRATDDSNARLEFTDEHSTAHSTCQ